MSIDLNTAAIIEMLARAANCIGSTPASDKINKLIINMLPSATGADDESITEALREDNAALQLELAGTQKSAGIMAENLALMRERMEKIHQLVSQELVTSDDVVLLLSLSAPATDPVEA